MEKFITTFARTDEFDKAESALKSLGAPYQIIVPGSYGAAVDVPAIVVDEQVRCTLYSSADGTFVSTGWIEYHPAANGAPDVVPDSFTEDIFGKAHLMVVSPCVAAPGKIRFIAHLGGDLSPVFPYLNAIMPNAFYNVNGPTFTFMDGYRMITAYPKRVAAAKADDIVDAWRVLSMIRSKANECWAARSTIQPSNELRRKPPALEIYNRLPKTNCRECGEKTCMAFALTLWSGQIAISACRPVFGGAHTHLKDALVEICGGLGIQNPNS